MEIDPEASHASWMENFPWTRIPGVAMPKEKKPQVNMEQMRMANPAGVRKLVGDGNYHGVYERSDAEMHALWQVAVEETRGIIEHGWPA
jgi:creatinine amidohydrolase